MYPYGDTRRESPPIYVDDADERAARWTLRLLAVSVTVVVLAATVVFSLMALQDDPAPSDRVAQQPENVETVTTLPPPPEYGPAPGSEVPGYVASRKAALAANRDERVAVVSFAKYSTQAQSKTLIGSLQPVALLVAPPGAAPSVVTGDLAAWVATQTEETRAEREEIRKLIPTVTDAAFKTFYNEEVARLDKVLKNFSPTSSMVFGAVVRGPAAALQALGAKSDVRLVDVTDTATPDAKAVFRGLRPEEVARANEPPMRPA